MARLALVAFLGVLSLGGCVVHSNPPNNGGAVSGTTQFLVRNHSSVAICYVNISPSSDGNWGPDRLGASETIPPGTERGWAFPAGYYDFRLQDCQRNVIMERRQLVFPANDGLVLDFRAPE